MMWMDTDDGVHFVEIGDQDWISVDALICKVCPFCLSFLFFFGHQCESDDLRKRFCLPIFSNCGFLYTKQFFSSSRTGEYGDGGN